MNQKGRFSEKVCLVTGGGSGIGKATAIQFASEEGRVAVVDLNPEHGTGAVEAIRAAGGVAEFFNADVGSSADIHAVVDQVIAKWGKIDVLVNDAATMTFKPIVDLEEKDWDMVLRVNLKSVFLFCKLVIPRMPRGSAIVNVSSVHAHSTTKNVVPYATSKGGMEAFTRGLSEEIASKGIRVNCVAPGAVNTPMLWNNPNVKSGVEKVTGAIGQPENLAAAICFLASSEAAFVNGTTLIVDGGRLDQLS